MSTQRTNASLAWEERKSHFTTANDRTAPINFANLCYLEVDDEDAVEEDDVISDTSDPMLICMARGL